MTNVKPEEFHDFLLQFKSLRGDYGLRRNKKLEEKLYPNIVKIQKEMSKRVVHDEPIKNQTAKLTTGTFSKRGTAKKKLDRKAIKEMWQQEEDSDNIPDEPLNHVQAAQRQNLVEKYSLDKKTGTLPADRVLIEGEKKIILFKPKIKRPESQQSNYQKV